MDHCNIYDWVGERSITLYSYLKYGHGYYLPLTSFSAPHLHCEVLNNSNMLGIKQLQSDIGY